MFFASDNASPAHPAILQALAEANAGYVESYGDDPVTDEVHGRIREVFEAPNAAVHLIATGTAANATVLATLARPWDTIYCSQFAHIQVDECNAPEFFTGGAKLTLVPGEAGKFTAEALRKTIAAGPVHGLHGPQRGPVSITQVSDCGTVFTLDEIAAIAEVAHGFGLPLHMDGARFANAMVALGATPAEMSWKAGVDALCFGGTKNGLFAGEAVIFFDPKHSWEFELRRKRAGHLFSKNRFLSAQFRGYLRDDLWLTLARDANAAAARLVAGMQDVAGVAFTWTPQANIVFAAFPAATHRRLLAAGADYEVIGDLDAAADDDAVGSRLVCSWCTEDTDIDRFLDVLSG